MSTAKLAILQINDTHGYLDEHQEVFWDGDGTSFERVGGFAKIKDTSTKFGVSTAKTPLLP